MVELKYIRLNGISKKLGDKQVLSDVNVELTEGRITCFMAPSGWGKTTLLNIIAGLTKPDSGVMTGLDEKTKAYAFQEPRLLPWKNVRDNIDFVLKDRFSEEERARRIEKWLKVVHLEDAADLMPAQLSGGMAQRASLARALALEADLVLLDEPFTGIDAGLKEYIIKNIKELWHAAGTTAAIITHDINEAAALGADITYLDPETADKSK